MQSDTPLYSYRNDPAVPAFPDDKPVIVFDGECGFCSAGVQFFLRREDQADYRYLPAQSPLGSALLGHYGFETTDYETALFLENGRAYARSEAILRATAGLGSGWSLARLLLPVPQALRDRIYDWIARNRMRIHGRLNACMVPTPQQASRFLK